MDDGYSGVSLVTGLGLGLARALAAAALPLPALAAALAVVAGLAGLEGVDLAAVDLVDDARLGGMTLKSSSSSCCCCWHLKDARVVGLLATDSCLLGSRVLPPITGAA